MRISHLAFLFSLAAAMTVQAQSPVASGSAAARAPRPVGHPVQPEDDRQALAAFLARVGMADSPSLAALQDCAGQSYVATSDARYASCTAGLGQIDTYFQRNPASIIQQSSKQDSRSRSSIWPACAPGRTRSTTTPATWRSPKTRATRRWPTLSGCCGGSASPRPGR